MSSQFPILAYDVSVDPIEQRKIEIATQAHNLLHRDKLTGHELNFEKMEFVKSKGTKGELELEQGLKSMGIPRDSYMTEDEQIGKQKASSPSDVHESPSTIRATPDILFTRPTTIHGRLVSWMEAKNSIVIPGVTPEKKMGDVKAQILKYNSIFGPGAILFTKCGFAEATQVEFESTLCLTPNETTKKQEKAKKKKVKKDTATRSTTRAAVSRHYESTYSDLIPAALRPPLPTALDRALVIARQMTQDYLSTLEVPARQQPIIAVIPVATVQQPPAAIVHKQLALMFPDKSIEKCSFTTDSTLTQLYLHTMDSLKTKGQFQEHKKLFLRSIKKADEDLLDFDATLLSLNLFNTVVKVQPYV